MSRIALFPGSFDPITNGHVEIVRRGLALFDEVVVGVGINSQKKTMFNPEQRMAWITAAFADEPRVRVGKFQGLTVKYAQEIGATFLLRGLRDASDFQYEKNINFLNKHLAEGIETVFLVSDSATQTVSSSLVREILRFKGDVRGLVPAVVIDAMNGVQ